MSGAVCEREWLSARTSHTVPICLGAHRQFFRVLHWFVAHLGHVYVGTTSRVSVGAFRSAGLEVSRSERTRDGRRCGAGEAMTAFVIRLADLRFVGAVPWELCGSREI